MQAHSWWRRWIGSVAVGALVMMSGGGRATAAEIRPGFQERIHHDASGDHKYTLFVPAAYTADKPWPLIVFLHGAGARGTDNKGPMLGGLAPIVKEREATFPFIVVFPQCEDIESRLFLGWQADTADGQRVFKILDDVEHDLNVDRKHEVLTGGSMGGYGTWSLISAHPDRWSAAVVIAGNGDPAMAPQLKNIAVWAFHGTEDIAIPIEQPRSLVAALRAAGGRAFLTEMPGMRHNIGYVVYREDAIYDWMLNPQSEPKPEGVLRNVGRPQTDADMGRDSVQPFVPAVEVPQAVLVRLDAKTILSLAEAVPAMIPEGALSGSGENVYQTKRAFFTKFDITLSGINYRGTLERLLVTPNQDGYLTLAFGLRDITFDVAQTQMRGGIVSAVSGPMDVVVGHRAPVYLTLRVRPYVSDRQIHFELGDAQFDIPDDNWYVTQPQVDVRGLLFTRNRVSQAISTNMVNNAYGRKGEIESRLKTAAPNFVKRLEEQVNQNLSQPRTIGRMPMPAYQPRYKVWPDQIRVDESGITIALGMTLARPGLDVTVPPLKRIQRPEVKLADLPRPQGLEVAISSAVTEGLTAAIFDTGAATVDVRDLTVKQFAALGDLNNLVDAIPELTRYGDKVEVRSRIHVGEAMIVHPVGSAESNNSSITDRKDVPLNNMVMLEMPKLELRVDCKPAPDKPWTPCAVFDVHLSQAFQVSVNNLDFELRTINVVKPQMTEVAVTGHFAPGYVPQDLMLDTEKVAELAREAWAGLRRVGGLHGIPVKDPKFGQAKFRATEVETRDPFVVMRFAPAASRISNHSPAPVTYSVRVNYGEWGGPYTIHPGQSHDYHTPSALIFKVVGTPDEEIKTVPMGSQFVIGESSQTSPPAAVATSAPAGTARQ